MLVKQESLLRTRFALSLLVSSADATTVRLMKRVAYLDFIARSAQWADGEVGVADLRGVWLVHVGAQAVDEDDDAQGRRDVQPPSVERYGEHAN